MFPSVPPNPPLLPLRLPASPLTWITSSVLRRHIFAVNLYFNSYVCAPEFCSQGFTQRWKITCGNRVISSSLVILIEGHLTSPLNHFNCVLCNRKKKTFLCILCNKCYLTKGNNVRLTGFWEWLRVDDSHWYIFFFFFTITMIVPQNWNSSVQTFELSSRLSHFHVIVKL